MREKSRKWRKENPEKMRKAQTRWRKEHPESHCRHTQKWRNANPEKSREQVRRHQSRRRAASRRSILPATIAAIVSRFALWGDRCAFCGVDANHSRNHRHKRLTLDHVLALTNHGLDEPGNIMPACVTCNTGKRDHPIESWYRRQPFFTEARWRKIQRHCPAAVMGQLSLAMLKEAA
jgi:predicted restriction endonuclease